jgi:hypothetical protein
MSLIMETGTQTNKDGSPKGKVSYMTCDADEAKKWTKSNGGNAYGYAMRYAHEKRYDCNALIVTGQGVYVANVKIDSDGNITQDLDGDIAIIHNFQFDKADNVKR